MKFLIKNILWVDCLGAIATGALMIALRGWIGSLNGLPVWLVFLHGGVHVIYGSYSLSLAIRKTRPMSLIKLLVFANAGWASLCVIFAAISITSATGFAAAQFVIEGVYVGTLALIEWNGREELAAGNA